MPTLYDIIADLRRERPTPSAAKTLDMVVAELGQTQDNLRSALDRLDGRPVPVGGQEVLEDLASRAHAAGVDDEHMPLAPDEIKASEEPLDESQLGIGLLLGGSAALSLLLVALAILFGLNSILHWF
jgi:hypothetical protein